MYEIKNHPIHLPIKPHPNILMSTYSLRYRKLKAIKNICFDGQTNKAFALYALLQGYAFKTNFILFGIEVVSDNVIWKYMKQYGEISEIFPNSDWWIIGFHEFNIKSDVTEPEGNMKITKVRDTTPQDKQYFLKVLRLSSLWVYWTSRTHRHTVSFIYLGFT